VSNTILTHIEGWRGKVLGWQRGSRTAAAVRRASRRAEDSPKT
jgi:hypothetical protein